MGTWIEICDDDSLIIVENRRSLRGNVDRNTIAEQQWRLIDVVPYVGTWIEIYLG